SLIHRRTVYGSRPVNWATSSIVSSGFLAPWSNSRRARSSARIRSSGALPAPGAPTGGGGGADTVVLQRSKETTGGRTRRAGSGDRCCWGERGTHRPGYSRDVRSPVGGGAGSDRGSAPDW